MTTYYRPDIAVEGLSFTKGPGLGARRAVAEAHEFVHVGRAIRSPQLTYLGAFSRGPGAGFANIALEAEAYYLTEGLNGLRNVLPSVANSGRLRHVAVDFGIAGLIGGTACWAFNQ